MARMIISFFHPPILKKGRKIQNEQQQENKDRIVLNKKRDK